MNADRRFFVDERSYITDTLNPSNSGKCRYCDLIGSLEDKKLREQVLLFRLREFVEKLTPHKAEIMQYAIFDVILPSHLNTFDPMLAFQHKSDGILKRPKEGDRDISSLSLFCDDVERLLRDLYGDFESEALETALVSVSSMVRTIANYVCPDLGSEDSIAETLDWMSGIRVPEGYCPSGSDYRNGMWALTDLKARVRDIFTTPSCCWSPYTVEFANRFNQHWDCGVDSLSSSLQEPSIDLQSPGGFAHT
jgi:hypothetical protein